MPIYVFYWEEDEEFMMEIDANEEEVRKLLDKYRASAGEWYDVDGWAEFLSKTGVKARLITIEAQIYF